MADIRTLKLALLADTKDFIAGLDKADKEAKTFSDKLGGALKTAATAFVGLATAAGTAAFAIGVSAVKAAIEAQKEDALLEQSIKNLTNATAAQTKATFDYLDAAENAAGVNADQLKPSFERILRNVKDLTKAQDILKVAQDVAAGTGKNLTEVADALARAYDGNVKGLKDLGIELQTTIRTTKKVKVSKDDLTKAELSNKAATLGVQAAQERLNKVLKNVKSDALDVAQAQNSLERAQLRAGDAADNFEKKQNKVGKSITTTKEVARPFSEILADLSKQYEGAASAAAETYAGRLAQISTALTKVKEDLGFALLPLFETFVKFVQNSLVPALQDFIAGLTGGTPKSVKNAVKDVRGRIIEFNDGLTNTIGTEGSGAFGLGIAVRELATQFGRFNVALQGANGEDGLKAFIDNLTKLLNLINTLIAPFARLVELSQAFSQSQQQARIELPQPIQRASNTVGNVVNNFITNIKGAVDPQGTARQIVKVQNTALKTTGIRVGPGRA